LEKSRPCNPDLLNHPKEELRRMIKAGKWATWGREVGEKRGKGRNIGEGLPGKLP